MATSEIVLSEFRIEGGRYDTQFAIVQEHTKEGQGLLGYHARIMLWSIDPTTRERRGPLYHRPSWVPETQKPAVPCHPTQEAATKSLEEHAAEHGGTLVPL